MADFSKGTHRSLARIAVEEGNDTEAASRICRKCVELVLHFSGGTSVDAIQVFALRGGL